MLEDSIALKTQHSLVAHLLIRRALTPYTYSPLNISHISDSVSIFTGLMKTEILLHAVTPHV